MSGLTIQELLKHYPDNSIDTVQCLESKYNMCNETSFRSGGRYRVSGDKVMSDDGNMYNFTNSKFGNPIFKKDAIGKPPEVSDKPEDSGGSCDYYKVLIENPTTAAKKYTAECNDVIEALDMTYAEANMFKEIWRSASARTLGKLKAGHSEARGAEKIEFFAKRNAIQKGVKQ